MNLEQNLGQIVVIEICPSLNLDQDLDQKLLLLSESGLKEFQIVNFKNIIFSLIFYTPSWRQININFTHKNPCLFCRTVLLSNCKYLAKLHKTFCFEQNQETTAAITNERFRSSSIIIINAKVRKRLCLDKSCDTEVSTELILSNTRMSCYEIMESLNYFKLNLCRLDNKLLLVIFKGICCWLRFGFSHHLRVSITERTSTSFTLASHIMQAQVVSFRNI